MLSLLKLSGNYIDLSDVLSTYQVLCRFVRKYNVNWMAQIIGMLGDVPVADLEI